MYRTKEEKLKIVLDIVKKLRQFPTVTGTVIDLYNADYPATIELKKVFNEYIQKDLCSGLTGKIDFPEIGRTIHYTLPIKKQAQPTFVLRK
jgi:hypothetical protein